MKIRYLLTILMVILLVGCASKQPEAASAPQAQPSAPQVPTASPAVPETQPAAQETQAQPTEQPSELTDKEKEAISGADVALTKEGFDPAELTVAKGASVLIKVTDERRHAISSINSDFFRSKSLAKGDVAEVVLDKTGEFNFLDVTFGNHLKIIVQ